MNSANAAPRRPSYLNWRHFAAVAGPGLVVMLADTDAGSIITAAQSGALNVKINLGWIEDKSFTASAWARIETILAETARLRKEVMDLTYQKLG